MIKLTEVEKIDEVSFALSKAEPLSFIPGIWVNGKSIWLQGVREKVLYEEQLTVRVTLERTHSKIYYYRLFVSNHGSQTKNIKVLAAYHHPKLVEKQFTFASPTDRVAFHLINQDVYMVNGQCRGSGIKEYSIQPYWDLMSNQIWNCQEQGTLKYQPMVKGPAASIFALDVTIQAHATEKVNTWVVQGKSKQEVTLLNQMLVNKNNKK